MKLGEIISEYRRSHNLSLRDFASVCDLSYTYIMFLERGVNPTTGKEINPNLLQLKKLASGMGITLHELLTKTDDIMVDITPAPNVTEDVVEFTVIGDVAAHYDCAANQNWDGEKIEVPRSWLRGRPQADYFALRVRGDSMYPLYHDGDIVLVKRQATLDRSGQIGVVTMENDATLKKVEFVMGEDWMRLIPINPNYPPITVNGEQLEHCHVLGYPVKLIRDIKQ